MKMHNKSYMYVERGVVNIAPLFIQSWFYFQVLPFVDTMLFSLLILKGLCDSRGLVWRCRPTQFYAVEITVAAKMVG